MAKWLRKLYNINTKLWNKSASIGSQEEKNPVNDLVSSGDGAPTETNIMDVSGQWCSLPCRSIRIGSYKVLPKERISVTEKGVQIRVPGIVNPSEVVVISIPMKDILKVLAHFGKSMPLLFLYVTPSACQKARKLLKMTNSQSFYFDVQSQDDTQKRITILPEKLTEENKMILKQHFSGKVQELESKDANEILVRSSPKDIPMLKSKMLGGQPGGSGGEKKGGEVSVVKYCQYPPDMAGNLTITNDDYSCLEAEQFLNDVIIDFYLKYLQFGKFTNKQEVMNRTHIFTTFFYKRLTTRPAHNKGKSHPIEDDPHLSAAEKRYKRVERWIKKINLFEKDFIVVPINEHAHWFVCVICYPGQMGCVNAETGEKCETPASQARSRGNRTKKKTVKKPMTIGSTTIIPLKGKDDIKFMEEEGSDRDEAEASDDEVEEDEEEAIKKTEQEIQAKLAIKQPCILTFDSLAGGSKARTHQTLREYLTCEWKTKMVAAGKEERVFTKDNMPGGSPKVQQQPNFSDCGIYLLQYVESFFKDPIIDYTLPIKSLAQWFTKEEVENKRNDIAVLIRELAAAQNPGKELTFPSLNFHNPPEDESDEDDDEDYEDGGAQVKGRTPNVQIVSGVGENRLIRLSNGATGSRIVMTPPSKGKFLIQKTGNQVKMSPYTTTSIPPGVTVTPSAPLRQLPSNNISVRTVSVRGNSETVQTSPDSTSQETDNIDTNTLEARAEDESGESDQSITVPDSQSQTDVGQIKRPADIGFDEMQGKRIKSDTES